MPPKPCGSRACGRPCPGWPSHGGATVLFWVLFSSLSLTLYGFFRRLFPAYLPEVAVFMGVAVTSRYKLDINGAPLQLSDFAFVGNLGDITGYAAAQLIPTLTTLLAIGVAAVPGSSFFREPVNHLIRLHFARSEETLNEALERLAKLPKLV